MWDRFSSSSVFRIKSFQNNIIFKKFHEQKLIVKIKITASRS